MTALDNFMHSTSHDLGIIINSVELLRNNQSLSPDQRRWLDNIYQAQRDLVRKKDNFYIENKDKFK